MLNMYIDILTSTSSPSITALPAMCVENDSTVISEHQTESSEQIDVRAPMLKKGDPSSDTEYLNGLLKKVAVSQDKEAFKELFTHFAPRIKGFFQGQGSSADKADEVV